MYKQSEPSPLPLLGGTRKTSTPNLPAATNKQNPESVVLVSGYLTKRTRSVLPWKRRWWQLIGNGTLIYFKKADRHKMLGEMDIAHSCYDVLLGAELCPISFPRSISPQSCFSFATLKRTYYMYAPPPSEAKRWVESLTSVSYLLNCNRPRELSIDSSVSMATEAKDRFAPPPSVSAPSPKAPVVVITSQSSSSPEEEEASPTIYSLSQILNHPSYHHSVPDLRFDEASHNPGLWLDGSPQKDHTQGWPLQRERALSQLALVNPYSSSLRNPETRRATMSSVPGRTAKRASTGFAFCDIPEHEVMDGDFGGGGGTLPRQSKTKRPSSSLHTVDLTLGSSYERLEQLQEREDAIRLRLKALEQRSKAYSKKSVSFSTAAQPVTTSSYTPTFLPSMATEVHYPSPEGPFQESDSSPQSKSLERRSGNQPQEPPETPPKTPPMTPPKTPPMTPPKTPPKTLPKTPPNTPPKMPPNTPPKRHPRHHQKHHQRLHQKHHQRLHQKLNQKHHPRLHPKRHPRLHPKHHPRLHPKCHPRLHQKHHPRLSQELHQGLH